MRPVDSPAGSPCHQGIHTLLAANQSDPISGGVQVVGFVASDDAAAKATVLELIDSIGLNPVDVGPLGRARELEALAFLNISLNVPTPAAGSRAGSSSGHPPPWRRSRNGEGSAPLG
jgi:predicted dinucleotide-binding enzyme